MSDTTGKSDELNLNALEGDYSIVGEVRVSDGRRTFLATRRSDGIDVLISVISTTGAAENNALSHFAADTKMLTGVRHPGVIKPMDSRWVGTNAFAVVSERPKGPTLRQTLSTGERFTSARIASLLQEVNGILAWAREQGVVHRGVTPDAIFIEPLTGRLQLALVTTPISSDRVPDSLADSAMIGKLTWALLAGHSLDSGDPEETLAALRPDLAQRVVDAVDRMRSSPGDVVHPDVADFLSTIATADVLKQAETELETQRTEYAEVLRVHRETAEAERTACERRAVEMEEKLADDRRDFEREVDHVRAELASDKAQLVAEREQLAYEIGSLKQRRGSDQPAQIVPESSSDLAWPDVDRRAHPRRFLGPALLAAGLLVAAWVVHVEQLRTNAPSIIAVGADTLVPTPPRVEMQRLPRGGFLSQSAAGTLSPHLTTPIDSTTSTHTPVTAPTATTRLDSTVHDTVVRIDTAARRERMARRDSALRRDTSLHRDSLGFLRPDTLPQQ